MQISTDADHLNIFAIYTQVIMFESLKEKSNKLLVAVAFVAFDVLN